MTGPGRSVPNAARAAWATAAILLAIYGVTLAPTVTTWDSGEFLSAIRTLGVPHPPGTPLFVFVANVWARTLSILPFAAAVNAGSAVAAALACGSLAWLVARWIGRPTVGILAGIIAGTTAAVWQSATETEVYSYSLLLVSLFLVVAELAGAGWSTRHRLLLAFLFGLAVPLHISALVAGPAVILLAATDAGGSWSVRASLAPAGAWLVAIGIGTVSIVPAAGGLVLMTLAAAVPDGDSTPRRLALGVRTLALTLLGASFVLVMLVRAQHDPGVNQGNPSTWSSLVEVVDRRQYDVPPLWPRRAPLWLQLGNVLQWADWQIASGLSDAPGPSPWRTPFTLVFAALGGVGLVVHRTLDRRSWRVVGVLLAAATLGVVLVLNLRAGPSFGWGVLPEGALREARERDYFFALAFAIWGVWAGIGLWALAERMRRAWVRALLFGAAALPAVLNWTAMDRRRTPDRVLAQALGQSLLESAPPNAVMVVEGDNDTYATWFAQHVAGLGRNIVPVTIPLLSADWYRAELARRHDLLDGESVRTWRGLEATLVALARGADRSGRPLTAAVSVDARERIMMGSAWRLTGMVYVRQTETTADGLIVDTAATRAIATAIERLNLTPATRLARDGTGRYLQRLLLCPTAALGDDGARRRMPGGLLESTCNFR